MRKLQQACKARLTNPKAAIVFFGIIFGVISTTLEMSWFMWQRCFQKWVNLCISEYLLMSFGGCTQSGRRKVWMQLIFHCIGVWCLQSPMLRFLQLCYWKGLWSANILTCARTQIPAEEAQLNLGCLFTLPILCTQTKKKVAVARLAKMATKWHTENHRPAMKISNIIGWCQKIKGKVMTLKRRQRSLVKRSQNRRNQGVH